MARDWDGHEIPAGVVAVGRSCPKGFEGISGRASLKRVNVTRFINAEK